MGHLAHRAHFKAPLELVFTRAVEPEMQPRLMPSITIHDIDGRGDEVGSGYRFRDRLLGRDLEARVEVVAVDRPHMHTSLTTYDNGTSVRWEMRFEPVDDGTDEIDTIDYTLPNGLLYRVADRLVLRRRLEQTLERGTERFRTIVEAEATAG
jgi:ligand-binding SRPBCC domain-containing protein